MKRLLFAVVAGFIAFAASIGACQAAARAHATLDRSTPAAGAAIAAPPRQVDLYFAESLADPGGASFATVLDAAGRTVSATARGDPADPRHLSVTLNGALDDGSYTVFWRTTSAADSGTTLGDFSFTVGTTAATAQQGTGGQVPIPDALRARALTSGSAGGPSGWLAGGAIGLVLGAAAAVGFVDLRARRASAAHAAQADRRKR